MVLLIANISVAAGWDWCCTAGESPDGGNRPLPESTAQSQVSPLLVSILIFLTWRVSVGCCSMNLSQEVFTFRIRIVLALLDPDRYSQSESGSSNFELGKNDFGQRKFFFYLC
jgi:hypothetical protein